MSNKTIHDDYLENQMQNPEFRAYYTLAREKIHLENMIFEILNQLKENTDRKVIMNNLKKVSNYISKIAF